MTDSLCGHLLSDIDSTNCLLQVHQQIGLQAKATDLTLEPEQYCALRLLRLHHY